MLQFHSIAIAITCCVGDVDSRWAKSSGETAGTWSDPDLSGETESSKSGRVRHQQVAAQIQPGQHRRNQVGTNTWQRNKKNTHIHISGCHLNTWIYIYVWMWAIAFRNFTQSDINLTLYTVNEPWLYSVLWCSDVSSVSSEAPQILKKVPYPVWLMVRTAMFFLIKFLLFNFSNQPSWIVLITSFKLIVFNIKVPNSVVFYKLHLWKVYFVLSAHFQSYWVPLLPVSFPSSASPLHDWTSF